MAYLKVACLVAKPLNRIEAMVTLLINQSINQSIKVYCLTWGMVAQLPKPEAHV